MRYRLTVISVIAAALAAAALLFMLSRDDDPPPERGQTELFPDGLGIVAAITATAMAGGAALDPTALASPTSTSVAGPGTPVAGKTSSPEAVVSPQPVVSLSEREVAPGDTVTVRVSGASPGEGFQLTLGTSSVVASSTAGVDGLIVIEVTVPEGLKPGSLELAYEGAVSGTSSVAISVAETGSSPGIVISPVDPAPGESITVSAEDFEPGEPLTVKVSGEIVASGIAGIDGSFSVTTGLPAASALPGQPGRPQQVSVEGENGSGASAEIGVGGPVSERPTEALTVGGAKGETGQPGAAGESGEDPPGGAASTGRGLPAWLYLVIGIGAGWIGVLTLWVIRIDRGRDTQVAALAKEIDRLVRERDAGREPLMSGRGSDTVDRGRAA